MSALKIRLIGVIALLLSCCIRTGSSARDALSLPQVVMPNRHGFTSPDPRPDAQGTLCMKDCSPGGPS
jgi:hypothetical protein